MSADATPAHLSDEARRRRAARRALLVQQTKRVRKLLTPEGATLDLVIASAGERAGAFLIDLVLQFLLTLIAFFAIVYTMSAVGFEGDAIAQAVFLLTVFAIRNFYFIAFEIGSKAATPGKRALGLRVVARSGGRLTADAVFARNFTREMEVFLPLNFLISSALSDSSDVSGWIALAGLAWSSVFLLMPLLNKDKLRAGDIVAGTWVIRAPKTKLLSDIASTQPETAKHSTYEFTAQQLDAYGIHELHVLEDVLRQASSDVRSQVAERIRQKIGWQAEPNETDIAFLEAYYASLRGRLEQRLLLGDRKADKYG
ncbi:MAG: RDD family protein [Pseudomonadota bacterium]